MARQAEGTAAGEAAAVKGDAVGAERAPAWSGGSEAGSPATEGRLDRDIHRIQAPGDLGRWIRLNIRPAHWWVVIALVHLGLGLAYMHFGGLSINDNPGHRAWDWWWQTIPTRLLVEDLGRSLWFLHSQPPVFNLYGAIFFRLFSHDPMAAMQVGNIALGSLLSGMAYLVLLQLTGRPRVSVVLGLVLALDAGLFLYEAYLLYDVLSVFLIVGSVAALAAFARTHKLRFAATFMLAVNLLILTRSIYHVLVALAALAALAVAAPRQLLKKALLIGSLISLLSVGWYLKNYFVFGFFGASSWQGFSLWKVASDSLSEQEVSQLATEGVVDRVVAEVGVFRPASEYVPYGYTRQSDIPVLNQDDQNNINVIEVSRTYQANALRLIVREPRRYLRTVLTGWQIFNLPSTLFKHHQLNVLRMPWHAWLTGEILQGHILDRYTGFPMGTVFFFLIPLSGLVYGGAMLYHGARGKQPLGAFLRGNSVETWIAFLIAYTTLVGVSLEVGENNRYGFYIESLVVIFLAAAASRAFSAVARQARWRSSRRGASAAQRSAIP
jgi:hypothetical protein